MQHRYQEDGQNRPGRPAPHEALLFPGAGRGIARRLFCFLCAFFLALQPCAAAAAAEDTDGIASEEELETVQSVNSATMAAASSGVVDVAGLTQITAAQVKAKISSYYIPDSAVYLDGAERKEGDLDDIIARRNIDAVTDPVTIRYGIVASDTMVRRYPTWSSLTETADSTEDYFQETMLLTGEGVDILHQTADGVWSFVQSRSDFGWIETSHIAFCSREDMDAFLNPEDFIVVTDSWLASGDLELRMGTKLPVVQAAETDYTVLVPRVSGSGTLYFTQVTIQKSLGVSRGYLSITQESVQKLAQRLLNMPYAEGDSGGYMDSVSALDAIFLCFGVILPRHVSQLNFTGASVIELRNMTDEAKSTLIADCNPGSILVMDDHAALYLGLIDGEPAIFQEVKEYSTSDGALISANKGVITPLDVRTSEGTSYLSLYRRVFSVW